ncbi:FtsX-like permease family protein [Staphylococcus auricularis]|uniref:FtsX-like permease family protein n=1 Tax=Staphylococcus auricularis TaxID=29379 RepID=A0AAW7MCH0_9STAP|nr:FtsX-like permease family protein [Staphylococcus auricularis]MDC6327310.1 FtsX-like permease family protein [Staphylococcus auricularis]MDN4532976.1 FtsX-like permease family protein [Staphylococcus auricularis]
MSFNHIVLKNLRQNLKHYAMFLISLLLSIIIYFSFATLKYTDEITAENARVIKNGAMVGLYALFVIIVVFLMYANHLFIKRRTKSFALFQLIGLTRGNILRMLCIEQLAFFVATGILGILLGLGSSQLLLIILGKLMELKVNINISFEPKALLVTLLLLVIAYILIFIQNAQFLKKRSILTMMKDSSQTEAKTARITPKEVLSGVLGIIMIVLGYYLSTEMMDKFANILTPFIILALTIVGAYLFFRSTVSVIFKSLKRLKKGHVGITDVVFTSSIMHRMKKNAMSLTVIAIISAITVTVLCSATIVKVSTAKQIEAAAPEDFDIVENKLASQFENKLQQANIPYNKTSYQVLQSPVKHNKVFTVESDNVPSINRTTLSSNNHLKGNEAKITNISSLPQNIKVNLNQTVTVQGKTNAKLKVTSKDENKVYPVELTAMAPVLEVSPQVYQSLRTEELEVTEHGYNLKNQDDMAKAEKVAQQVNSDIESKRQVTKSNNQTAGIMIFVSAFLGFAFLIAAGCIIYIKQMDETEDELPSFKLLHRIGFTNSDMMPGLTLKVLFNFGLPLIIALLHSFFAASAFMNIMSSSSHTPVFIVMIVYTIVYAIFALIALIHSRRMINQAQ